MSSSFGAAVKLRTSVLSWFIYSSPSYAKYGKLINHNFTLMRSNQYWFDNQLYQVGEVQYHLTAVIHIKLILLPTTGRCSG